MKGRATSKMPPPKRPRKSPVGRRDAGRPRGEPVLAAVLAATLDELAAHGFDRLSVDRIARAAEVNKTSVYRRWPTREALVAAALERVVDDMDVEVADTGTLRGDLMPVVRSLARLLSQPAGRALALAAIAAADAPELAAMAQRRLAQGAAGPVAAMVARAQLRGEWRADVAPQPVLSMLVGAVLHRALFERAGAGGAWLDAVIDVVVRGVAPR